MTEEKAFKNEHEREMNDIGFLLGDKEVWFLMAFIGMCVFVVVLIALGAYYLFHIWNI